MSDTTRKKPSLKNSKTVGELLTFLHESFSAINVFENSVTNANKQNLEALADDSEIKEQKIINLAKPLEHMHLDSRLIQKNDVFIAIQGTQQHGLDYLDGVLKARPEVILCDRELTTLEKNKVRQQQNQPQVLMVSNLGRELGQLASWFYDYPSNNIKVVGITGTNGKTSTAFFTAQLLSAMQQKVALMGTLGNGPLDDLQASVNTTPNAVTVQRLLRRFLNQGMQWCIMEVSSHALSLGRVKGVEFESVAMTQITRDHLDFHGTEEAYKEAKKRLFNDYPSKHKIINVADNTGIKLFNELLVSKTNTTRVDDLVLYSATEDKIEIASEHLQNSLFLKAQKIDYSERGIHCQYQFNDELAEFDVSLMGAFNIENCFCSLSILLAAGFELKKINPLLTTFQPVQGRMQLVYKNPSVIIDFAHTPDALQQVLQAVKTHLVAENSSLTVVFGCGGDRDKGKRPLMGAVAEKLADRIVLTSDNPRSEEPLDIIIDTLKGVSSADKVIVIEDREIAITSALDLANKEDIVVIAGKGHEAYQEIKGVKHAFSDAKIVQAWQPTEKARH